MGALTFASPALLVALVALPAIWFLLRATPPSPQQIRFPAFDILRRLQKTPETPHRTPWWLLLMRLLIAGLIIFGLAGPVLNAPPPPTSGGPLIVVLDGGWAAAPGWRLRRDALRTIGEQAARADREIYFLPTTDDDDAPISPITGEEAIELSRSIEPAATAPDYANALRRVAPLQDRLKDAETIWLSDGVAHEGSDELAGLLKSIGAVTADIDAQTLSAALYPPSRSDNGLEFRLATVNGAPLAGEVVALARDGRELARGEIEATADGEGLATLSLPLALQNDIAQARIEGVPSAGAVQLVDARQRRALIGFVASGEANIDPLLAGQHYVRQALSPYAMFVTDTLENLLASDASVIVLDDIGVVRPADADALGAWIEKGGVVLRFAGSTLAEAAEDSQPALLPVPLRGGGRAFGGALTWETPQPLVTFSDEGPFAGLVPPKDVFIRRQVLAEPGGETSQRSWASLADGTPLVTGEIRGQGALALFHVTATPEWSDLPLSEIFVEMLRKIAFLSTLGPAAAEGDKAKRLAAFRTLDGFGVLRQPARDLAPATLEEIDAGAAPARPPGFYGAPEAPIALNAVREGDEFKRFSVAGVATHPYVDAPPTRIGPPLFVVALLLLLADAIIALRLAGRLPFLAAASLAIIAIAPAPLRAQPLERPISEKADAAALSMRLAYVRTGDPATDRISEAGLAALTAELTRRTSAEPAPPAAVDPETDDLSVYPFLYWPVTPGAANLSDQALANIETFMRFGGLIVFDTRDDERAVSNAETAEGAALKAILAGLDIPPLKPIGEGHVLYRSFYLLSDLFGRMATRPVWVQAGAGPNDSVTPLIIGGRDWAGAWAATATGEPLLPVRTQARPCADVVGAIPRNARECAYRAGVNMVMVALSGNYKSDQVHTPILLERLGRE